MNSCKVPATHKEDGYRLGAWVSVQRLGKDKLSDTRLNKLNTLGFVWDPHKEAWEEGFRQLWKFHERERHCLVRRGQKGDGLRLDLWVVHQRQKKDSLSKEQIERLDAIGFVWDPITAQWEEGFNKLLKFYERMNSCKVPATHKEDGYRLGAWVQTQRRSEDSMSAERKQILDDIGFIWDFSKDKT